MTEKRDAYVQQLKAKVDEWNAEIDKLQAKTVQADAQMKIEYQKKLDYLKSKRKEIEDKIAELHQASEDSWHDIKEGIEKSLKILGESFDKAKSEFK